MKYSSFRIVQVFFGTILLINACLTEKVNYISTERPVVSYINPKYASFATVTARRHSRSDPMYYMGFDVYVKTPMAYNVSMNFYFYEWLTNQYKRGFVEMHFELCDLVHNNEFFGAPMRQGGLEKPCPYPAGEYKLDNMSIPVKQVPPNFPFRKGRIYLNVSSMDTGDVMGTCHIDMEIKQYTVRNKEVKNKKH